MPHLPDAGAKDLGRDLGRDLGAAATANLLRIVESGTTRLLVSGLLLLGAGALAFYTLRELRSGTPVQHEVVHRDGAACGEPPAERVAGR